MQRIEILCVNWTENDDAKLERDDKIRKERHIRGHERALKGTDR